MTAISDSGSGPSLASGAVRQCAVLLMHLIRILESQPGNLVDKLDENFRRVPGFGTFTIRKFAANVSEMKKLAARDFEDILQCAIPCFEGLLPEPHDSNVRILLFTLAYWHGLAKLRMHTDSSLALLDTATTALGEALRQFEAVTCPAFTTQESSAEYSKRMRNHARLVTRGLAPAQSAPSGRRPRTFNMKTPKTHFLGDYVANIRATGTTDSGSTQTGEFKHCDIKRRYARTNKKDADEQLVAQDVITSKLNHMADELHDIGVDVPSTRSTVQLIDDEATDPSAVQEHHRIAVEQRNTVYLSQLIADHPDDPALHSFVHDLRTHLHSRLLATDPSWPADAALILDRNCLFAHATARVNFTTYDLRRAQDIIHVGTDKCFVMVHTPGSADGSLYPWTYAQVLGIYHANVLRPGSTSKLRMELLWVRWLERDQTWSSSANDFRLPRVSFLPSTSPDAFGFIDPADVLRASHLIPGFHYGRTFSLLGPSLARNVAGDWRYYYVNRFVDRDIVMRYVGLGVGHLTCRAQTVDKLDVEIVFSACTADPEPPSSPQVGSAESESATDSSMVACPLDEEDETSQDEYSSDEDRLLADLQGDESDASAFEDDL
ncbi:uncharacterized protein B0H18DRAFT_1116505 [Fomitopsis serialis]|uniref:uncharacterized protein n=1 Tax=Fomitopsis serialis TaxID=139415 RepID=UPI002007F752|nr:uncharacterized protein B0H18DRAFT_1116505 [Neoantrodia serialis]KAH9931348.1 hypothetical protein B0H18DRAFT_1116505 [Neoantrodia serialis]